MWPMMASRPPGAHSSSRENSAASPMQPYLITSPRPSRQYSGVRVVKTSGSHKTRLGCQKAPTRFLPWGRSTATLPPTEESTWASSVVGICTNRTPRR